MNKERLSDLRRVVAKDMKHWEWREKFWMPLIAALLDEDQSCVYQKKETEAPWILLTEFLKTNAFVQELQLSDTFFRQAIRDNLQHFSGSWKKDENKRIVVNPQIFQYRLVHFPFYHLERVKKVIEKHKKETQNG
jgi:hypothetical protein